MATSLSRWDPFADLATLRSMMERMRPSYDGDSEEFGPATLAIDVSETSDDYRIRTAIPGVRPEDVDISIENDVLTIRGEFEEKAESEEQTPLRREMRYGSFYRSLRLPSGVDAENADATFENGVLELSLPKRPEAKPRQIKVRAKELIDGGPEHGGQQEGHA